MARTNGTYANGTLTMVSTAYARLHSKAIPTPTTPPHNHPDHRNYTVVGGGGYLYFLATDPRLVPLACQRHEQLRPRADEFTDHGTGPANYVLELSRKDRPVRHDRADDLASVMAADPIALGLVHGDSARHFVLSTPTAKPHAEATSASPPASLRGGGGGGGGRIRTVRSPTTKPGLEPARRSASRPRASATAHPHGTQYMMIGQPPRCCHFSPLIAAPTFNKLTTPPSAPGWSPTRARDWPMFLVGIARTDFNDIPGHAPHAAIQARTAGNDFFGPWEGTNHTERLPETAPRRSAEQPPPSGANPASSGGTYNEYRQVAAARCAPTGRHRVVFSVSSTPPTPPAQPASRLSRPDSDAANAIQLVGTTLGARHRATPRQQHAT